MENKKDNKLNNPQSEELRLLLIEGYEIRAEEDKEIADDFDHTLLDGIDD
jgi:hypothetical protein